MTDHNNSDRQNNHKKAWGTFVDQVIEGACPVCHTHFEHVLEHIRHSHAYSAMSALEKDKTLQFIGLALQLYELSRERGAN